MDLYDKSGKCCSAGLRDTGPATYSVSYDERGGKRGRGFERYAATAI